MIDYNYNQLIVSVINLATALATSQHDDHTASTGTVCELQIVAFIFNSFGSKFFGSKFFLFKAFGFDWIRLILTGSLASYLLQSSPVDWTSLRRLFIMTTDRQQAPKWLLAIQKSTVDFNPNVRFQNSFQMLFDASPEHHPAVTGRTVCLIKL